MPDTLSREALAAGYAFARQGEKGNEGWCLRFVAEAYGMPAAGYRNALEAGNALLGKSPNRDLSKARVGDLIWFSADDTNDNAGHVGIYLGGGKMLSATYGGVRVDSLSDPYWQTRFRGTTTAPEQWKGIDPAKIENPAVRQTTLAQAQRYEQIRNGTMSDTPSTLDRLRKQLDDLDALISKYEKAAPGSPDAFNASTEIPKLMTSRTAVLTQIAAEENRLRDDARGPYKPGEIRAFSTVINGELRENVPHEWVPDAQNPKGGEWQPVAGQTGTPVRPQQPVQSQAQFDAQQKVAQQLAEANLARANQQLAEATSPEAKEKARLELETARLNLQKAQRGEVVVVGGRFYPVDKATGLPIQEQGTDLRTPAERRIEELQLAAAEHANARPAFIKSLRDRQALPEDDPDRLTVEEATRLLTEFDGQAMTNAERLASAQFDFTKDQAKQAAKERADELQYRKDRDKIADDRAAKADERADKAEAATARQRMAQNAQAVAQLDTARKTAAEQMASDGNAVWTQGRVQTLADLRAPLPAPQMAAMFGMDPNSDEFRGLYAAYAHGVNTVVRDQSAATGGQPAQSGQPGPAAPPPAASSAGTTTSPPPGPGEGSSRGAFARALAAGSPVSLSDLAPAGAAGPGAFAAALRNASPIDLAVVRGTPAALGQLVPRPSPLRTPVDLEALENRRLLSA